jgi:hypothetical protein
MLIDLDLLKSKLLINLVLILLSLASILSVDCQASQLVDRSRRFDPQQISQADLQKHKRLVYADFQTNFQLKVGQTAIVKSEDFELKFLGVAKDSRCPADLNCFESGQINIAVKITAKGHSLGNSQLVNNASRKDLGTKQVSNYLIEFVKAEPDPKNTQRIKPSDYVVTLIVSDID